MGAVCNLVNLMALKTCPDPGITSLPPSLFFLQGGALWVFFLVDMLGPKKL